MRWRLLSLALVAMALPALADPVYVPGTEDVPLMPGLAAVEGGGVVFDKPEGRIVKAEARGHVTRAAVLGFYRASLVQLGWRPQGERRFERDGERLSLDFRGRDGELSVGFTLVPH
jgi:hypothetical protein